MATSPSANQLGHYTDMHRLLWGPQDGERYIDSQVEAIRNYNLHNELSKAQRERVGIPEIRMNTENGDVCLSANTTTTGSWHVIGDPGALFRKPDIQVQPTPTEELDTLISSYYVRSLLT